MVFAIPTILEEWKMSGSFLEARDHEKLGGLATHRKEVLSWIGKNCLAS
jgi:tRNA isopentenyl-2-thiomethyl-A-37 hydroxylase MiaE